MKCWRHSVWLLRVWRTRVGTRGGLWFSKPWASYLSVVVVGSFIPWQLYSLLDEVTTLKLISLCINTVIVGYLLVSIVRACVCHSSPRSRGRWWYCMHNGSHRILPPSDEKTSMTAMLDCPAPLWISALDLRHNWIPLDKGQSDARGRAHRTVLGSESRGAVTRIHCDTTLSGIWKIAF